MTMSALDAAVYGIDRNWIITKKRFADRDVGNERKKKKLKSENLDM